eukprot:790747_1
MAHRYQVFSDIHQCEIQEIQEAILKCQSIKRIQIILHEFNDDPLHKDPHKNESNLEDKFASIFIRNGYTNTSLLNDFHHIKYMHHADDNDDAFSKIYEHVIDGISTVCNEKKCRCIIRHYRDRSILPIECRLNSETHPIINALQHSNESNPSNNNITQSIQNDPIVP